MDIKSNFEIIYKKILDKQEFYTIYKGIDKINRSQIVVKKINFNKESNEELKDLINKEISNIRFMNLSNNSHHYINHFIENNNLFIFYENYDNNLKTFMNKTEFSIDQIKDIISQLNSIFKLLFDKNISHLDIKPSNILIKNENNNLLYLLSNYGFYNIQQEYLLNNKNNKDFAYIPPEVRLNLSNDLSKADLWSIGILLYYLYFRKSPFENEEQYLNYISNENKKLNINTSDKDLNNLIENLLISEASKRLSWTEYFNHKFFRNLFGRIYYDNYEIEYEGIFKDNKRYKGKEYDLYGGLEFEGEFNDKEERWNGKIKEFNENCKLIFEGEYINGNRVGKEYNDKSELVFEGEYKNGIRWNGKGKEENNLIIFKGNYKNGIRIGEELYENKKLKFKGDKNGKGFEYLYSGNDKKELEILFKGEYKNNKRWNGKGKETNIKNGNGIGKEYNINGKLEFEGEYKDGNKFKGIEYKYDKRKCKIYIDEYKEDNVWVGKEYLNYDKKIIEFEGEYKNGQKWKGKEYYSNGNIKFDGEYKNGVKWKGKEYHENGEIYFKGEYIKESYSIKFWIGYEYKDSKVIRTYKNGIILNDYFNIESMKNGIFFDDGNDSCSGFGKEYIYDELIFEGEYINNCRIKGREYKNNKLIFEGEYRNNNKWNGKLKSDKKNNLVLDGEYRYGNKKYYIYIPFYRNKKEYILNDRKVNKYNEIVYYGENNIIIREIPKYNYNIKTLKSQIENDKILNSINKTSRSIEFFDYKFNYYIANKEYECLKYLINKFKVKLPNDLIYQIILKIKNLLEIFEKNKIFYDLDSENILYENTRNINIYLDVDLYFLKSNFYYKKPKIVKSNDNRFNYKAPELYNDIKIDNLSKVNIWSLGILIFQMIFHEFPDINYQNKLNNENLLHNLIIKMLSIAPEKRTSINELNNDSLIKEINILYDNEIKNDLIIRVIFVGATYVGNNSLANSFSNNIPYLGSYAIVGNNTNFKLIYLNGLKILLYVTNTPGQERFYSMNNFYINRSDIIILTYDITDSNSLNTLEDRYNSIKDNNKNKIYGVCGNKIDLKNRDVEDEEEKMREFTLENNLDYYCRTSCVTYEGIEDMFYNLIDKYLQKGKVALKTKNKNEVKLPQLNKFLNY